MAVIGGIQRTRSTSLIARSRQVGTLTVASLPPVTATPSIGVITAVSGLAPQTRCTAKPSIGTVTLSGLVPKSRWTAKPPIGVVTLSGLAPLSRWVAKPAIGTVTLSGLVPKGRWVLKTPISTAVTLSGLVPKSRWIAKPSIGVITLSGLPASPVLVGDVVVTPSVGVINLSGITMPQPDWVVRPGLGIINLSGLVPRSRWVTKPSIGTITLSGLVPKGRWIARPTVGVVSLSGLAPTWKLRANPSLATVTLFGQVPKSRWVTRPSIGVITLSGLGPAWGYKVRPSVGVITLSGLVPHAGFGTVVRPSVGVLGIRPGNWLDSFSRPNEVPMTNWTNLFGGFKVDTNEAVPIGTGANIAALSAVPAFPDGDVQVTISQLPVNGGISVVYARLDPSFNYYAVRHNYSLAGVDTIHIIRADAGVETVLGSWGQDLNAGDGLRIRCVGSKISAYARVAGQWKLIGEVTDTTYPGALPWLVALGNVEASGPNARYDNFEVKSYTRIIWRAKPSVGVINIPKSAPAFFGSLKFAFPSVSSAITLSGLAAAPKVRAKPSVGIIYLTGNGPRSDGRWEPEVGVGIALGCDSAVVLAPVCEVAIVADSVVEDPPPDLVLTAEVGNTIVLTKEVTKT